jgi:hypothetical protein
MLPEKVDVIGTVYKGKCKFQFAVLTAAVGFVRISFYSLKGTYWGMFGGPATGVSGASLSGEGNMVWS